jgi:Spy/CpxP family protein refolding chaperone
MMKHKSMYGVLMLIVIMMLSMAFTQPANRDDEEFCRPAKGLMGIPNLTADQVKQIQKLRLNFQKEMLPLQTKIKAAKLDMQSLILEEADQKEIDQKIEEIGKMKIELQKKRMAHWRAIRNLLTDEQKAVFDLHKFGHQEGKGYDEEGARFHKEGKRPPMHKGQE